MRRFLLFLLPACVLGIAFQAQASTIAAGSYNLTSSSATGYSFTGNLTLNASGYVTAANITFNDPAVNTPTFTSVGSTGTSAYSSTVNYAVIGGATGQIVLDYLQSPDASGALSLCLYGQSCSAAQASYVQIYTPLLFNLTGSAYLSGGALTPVSALSSPVAASTPEPASLLLLGTGVLVLGAVLRGRSKRPGVPAFAAV